MIWEMKMSIEREIDGLGRIVLPKDYRKKLNILPKTKLSLELVGDSIILRREKRLCKICGHEELLDKNLDICNSCIKLVKRL